MLSHLEGKTGNGNKITMSKAGNLKMNPVGDPNHLDCDKSFHFHCPGDSADSEDFSILHWDPKRLLEGCLNRLAGGLGLYFPGAPNAGAPVGVQTVVPVLSMNGLNLFQRRVFFRDPTLPSTVSSLFFPKHLFLPTQKTGDPSLQIRGSLSFSEVHLLQYMSLRMEVHRSALVKKVSCNDTGK